MKMSNGTSVSAASMQASEQVLASAYVDLA